MGEPGPQCLRRCGQEAATPLAAHVLEVGIDIRCSDAVKPDFPLLDIPEKTIDLPFLATKCRGRTPSVLPGRE